jgi:hypothetical protein
MAQPRLDPALAAQAESALSRILAVLPPAARAAAESLALYAPPVGPDEATRQRLEVLRVATETRHKLRLTYLDAQQRPANAPSTPSAASSGARSGRWPRGARRGRRFGAFASIGSSRSICSTSATATNWGARWRIC